MLATVCFLWITVISNCFGVPVRKAIPTPGNADVLPAILRGLTGAKIRRRDALRSSGRAGAAKEISKRASQYPVILSRLETVRDDCFLQVTAISNRLGVPIRMALARGGSLLANVVLRAWAEKRRRNAGATGGGGALIASEVDFCKRHEFRKHFRRRPIFGRTPRSYLIEGESARRG